VQNIIGPTPFKKITNSHHYIQLILAFFYDKLREEKCTVTSYRTMAQATQKKRRGIWQTVDNLWTTAF
jgi:hypothetical protein